MIVAKIKKYYSDQKYIGMISQQSTFLITICKFNHAVNNLLLYGCSSQLTLHQTSKDIHSLENFSL